MPEPIDSQAILEAAQDPSPEGRSRLFQLLGQLFLDGGADFSDGERRGLAELLTILRPIADIEVRLALAHATAEATSAPSELARLLAEDEIEVAALVLFGAASLGVADLLALAEDEERALIIAGRRDLPMMLTDALMRRDDPGLARILLKNETTRFSITALDLAIELARDDADLQSRIARRPELLEEMAKDMAEWAEAPVRDHLVARFQLDAGADLGARLRMLVGLELENGPAVETEIVADPRDTGAAPDPRFRLSPRTMVEALRRGELVRAEAMFAQMARLPAPLIRDFARDGDGDNIALAARGIGMAREEFATLYLHWRKARSTGPVSAGELGAGLDRFDTIPQDRVEIALADWRRGA